METNLLLMGQAVPFAALGTAPDKHVQRFEGSIKGLPSGTFLAAVRPPMSALSQRRYMVTGNGITVHAQTLDEAIAAFRARARVEAQNQHESVRLQERLQPLEHERLPAA
jgi:hypothetical protein